MYYLWPRESFTYPLAAEDTKTFMMFGVVCGWNRAVRRK